MHAFCRSARLLLAVVATAIWIVGLERAAAQELPTIKTVTEFYSLSASEASKGYPVRIVGTVMYSDEEWKLLWISDQTDRLFQEVPEGTVLPEARRRVRVTGKTHLVDGVPKIDGIQFEDLGEGKLAPPSILMPRILNGDQAAPHRVTLAGTVIHTETAGDHLKMIVAFLRQFKVQVMVRYVSPEERGELLGAHVEVVGCSSVVETPVLDGLAEVQVFVPDMNDISVFQRGPRDPFLAPRIKLSDLEIEYLRRRDPRLIRVRGTVERTIDDHTIIVADDETQARVRLSSPLQLAAGTLVEAVGVTWKTDGQYVLEYANARAASAEEIPEPTIDAGKIVLSTAQAVRGLTPEQAAEPYSVELTGTVTYFDPVWRVLFVQDATGGIYVDFKQKRQKVRLGDRVRIQGISDPGGFAPMISGRELHRLGEGTLPAPRDINIGRALSGAEDSQWVRMEGVVEAVRGTQKNLVLNLASQEGTFEAVLMGAAPYLKQKQWVGARVRMTGVCGIKANGRRQVSGVYFHVPSMEQIELIDEPPANPFDIELVTLDSLFKFDFDTEEDPPQVKVSGQVTYVGSHGLVAIEDATCGMFLRLKVSNLPPLGSWIEVIGKPSLGRASPSLSKPLWRAAGSNRNPVSPSTISLETLPPIDFDGKLVRTEAIVIENNAMSPHSSLALQAGKTVFLAELSAVARDDLLRDVEVGSTIKLDAVSSVQDDEISGAQGVVLLVPEKPNWQLVRAGPWWTQQHTFGAAAVLMVLAVCSLLWVLTLRRRVSIQTEQIRQEMLMRGQMSARYDRLVENAGELIFMLNQSGVFQAVNPATERAFDALEEHLVGTEIWSRLDQSSADQLRTSISELGPKRPNAVLELKISGDSPAVLEMGIQLQSEAGCEEIQCIARDVSDRRHLEDQIWHLQKMESVGQLAAGVAHDYNNLMTVVLGNSDYLLDSQSVSSTDSEFLSQIRDAAERASNLTNQLLTFSRRRMMSVSMLEPDQLLTNLEGMLRRMAGEKIRFEMVNHGDLPKIRADGAMIEQAVANLVINAKDAMPEGGNLKITACGVAISHAHADRHAEALPGEYLQISVADDGTGIPPDVLPSIFEPFYTTKEVGKGTGLGLSTVFGIAKQHEGWVEVHSQIGKGTEFTIYIPSADFNLATVPIEYSLEHETILVVDDDRSVRLTMAKVLQRAGYNVIQCAEGTEALEAFASHKGDIDLVVTDMVMPGELSGRDVVNQLREQRPSLRFILCSGFSPELTRMTTLAENERLLPKPFENKMLVKLVRELLGATSESQSSITA